MLYKKRFCKCSTKLKIIDGKIDLLIAVIVLICYILTIFLWLLKDYLLSTVSSAFNSSSNSSGNSRNIKQTTTALKQSNSSGSNYQQQQRNNNDSTTALAISNEPNSVLDLGKHCRNNLILINCFAALGHFQNFFSKKQAIFKRMFHLYFVLFILKIFLYTFVNNASLIGVCRGTVNQFLYFAIQL